MTPYDDIEPETDRALDELLDAASDEAESETIERPPFAAVLGRARRLDPSLAAPEHRARPAARDRDDDAELVAALAPFVEAARAEAEADAIDRGRRSPPGLPRGGGPRLVRWTIVGGALAAAAAVLLLLGLLDVRDAQRAAQDRNDDQVMDQVEHERRVHEAETGGEQPEPLARAPRRRGTTTPGVPPATPDYVLPDHQAPLEELTPEEEPELEPTPEPEPVAEPTPAARRDRKREALRRLDEQAQSRLAAGDVAGAERAYRAIVRSGGHGALAELAYGDLFTLAHGRGDAKAQRELWQEYLRRFPRGRFADDARAGLCRRAAAAERTHCWERYLDDFPTGAYHRQAARALSRDEGPAPGEPAP